MSATPFNTEQELIAGKIAAKRLQSAIRSYAAVETVKRTGNLMKTNVVAKKNPTGYLDRLTITSPHYSFKLNYGFEGVKSNGVQMRLKPTKHLFKAIEETSILNDLADAISNYRIDQVIETIKF